MSNSDKQQEILAKVAAGTLTLSAAGAELAALAPPPAKRALSCKVSVKGALSVYGMGRFPITLYASQWEALFAFRGEVEGFIKAHPELARKE